MSEQLLNILQNTKGEILLKESGDVIILVNGAEYFLEHTDNRKYAEVFAKGTQVALTHFLGYVPAIKKEEDMVN